MNQKLYPRATLDGFLDFCGYGPALQLFRRPCHHDFTIDPRSTAAYSYAYSDVAREATQDYKASAVRQSDP